MSEPTDKTQSSVNYTILGPVKSQSNLATESQRSLVTTDLSTQATPPPLSTTDTAMTTSGSMMAVNEKEEMSRKLKTVRELQEPHRTDAVPQSVPDQSKPDAKPEGPTLEETAKETEIRSSSYKQALEQAVVRVDQLRATAQPKTDIPLDPDLYSLRNASPKGDDLKLEDGSEIMLEERKEENIASASLIDSTTTAIDHNLKSQSSGSKDLDGPTTKRKREPEWFNSGLKRCLKDMRTMKEGYGRIAEEQLRCHERELENLRKSHNDQLENLRNSHKNELDAKQLEITGLETLNNQLTNMKESRFEDVTRKQTRLVEYQVQQLKDNEALLKELSGALDRMKKQRNDLKDRNATLSRDIVMLRREVRELRESRQDLDALSSADDEYELLRKKLETSIKATSSYTKVPTVPADNLKFKKPPTPVEPSAEENLARYGCSMAKANMKSNQTLATQSSVTYFEDRVGKQSEAQVAMQAAVERKETYGSKDSISVQGNKSPTYAEISKDKGKQVDQQAEAKKKQPHQPVNIWRSSGKDRPANTWGTPATQSPANLRTGWEDPSPSRNSSAATVDWSGNTQPSAPRDDGATSPTDHVDLPGWSYHVDHFNMLTDGYLWRLLPQAERDDLANNHRFDPSQISQLAFNRRFLEYTRYRLWLEREPCKAEACTPEVLQSKIKSMRGLEKSLVSRNAPTCTAVDPETFRAEISLDYNKAYTHGQKEYLRTTPNEKNLHHMKCVCYDKNTPTIFYVRERIRIFTAVLEKRTSDLNKYYQNNFGPFPGTQYSWTSDCNQNPNNRQARRSRSPPRVQKIGLTGSFVPASDQSRRPKSPPKFQNRPRPQSTSQDSAEKCPQPPLSVQRNSSKVALNKEALRAVHEHNKHAQDDGLLLKPIAKNLMDQLELNKLFDKHFGEGNQLADQVRKRMNDILQDPDIRRKYGCPVLGKDVDLGTFTRKQMQDLHDHENVQKAILREDIARYNLISTISFPTSNLLNPGVTGETDQ